MKAELLTQPVLHADETPVAMLDPGVGKTHRLTPAGACRADRLVVFGFAESRAGRHLAEFLQRASARRPS